MEILYDVKLGLFLLLTHRLFVDDVLLFCSKSRRDVLKLKEVLIFVT